MDFGRLPAVMVSGVGATLMMDLWNLFLLRAFGIPSLNYRLVGRWLSHMAKGQFCHQSIAAAPPRPGEHALGWLAHYSIGIALAYGLFVIVSGEWFARPSLAPALLYGVATAAFPLFVMQPALGFGIASAKTPKPWRARTKSLMTHLVFGAGLYLCALGFNQLA